MQRIIPSILTLVLLLGQSLFSVPHSHAGTSTIEPGSHSIRPHFHLHGPHQGSHEHHGEPQEGEKNNDSMPSSDPLSDHDDDAIYTDGIQLSNESTTVRIDQSSLLIDFIPLDSTKTRIVGCSHHSERVSEERFKCAIYLQLRAIRC